MNTETPLISEEDQFDAFNKAEDDRRAGKAPDPDIAALEADSKAVAQPPASPAAQQTQAPVATPAPNSQAPTPPQEPFAGYSNLSDDAKAEFEKFRQSEAQKARDLEQKWKAQHNQLAPTQRELEKARRLLAEAEKRLQERENPPPAPKLDKFAKVRENFAEDADGFEELVDHKTQTLESRWESRLKELEGKLNQTEAQLQSEREAKALLSKHPDAPELGNDPVFIDWSKRTLEEFPTLLDTFKRGEKDSGAADFVFSMFKRDRDWFNALQSQTQQQQTATPTSPTKPAAKVTAIDPNLRNRQSALSSPNARMTEEDEFDAESKRIDAWRAAQRKS